MTRPPVPQKIDAASGVGHALDVARFERVMRQNNQRLFRVARAVLRDDAEAEDAVQEAYVSAFSRYDELEEKASLSSWLARVTVNEAIDRLRKRRRSDSVTRDDSDGGPSWRAGGSGSPGPEDVAAARELRVVLERAVDSLPDTLRPVLVMRDIEGMSSAETGAALEVSETVVRVRLHRARAQLREWIGAHASSALDETFSFAGERCDRIVAGVLARLAR